MGMALRDALTSPNVAKLSLAILRELTVILANLPIREVIHSLAHQIAPAFRIVGAI